MSNLFDEKCLDLARYFFPGASEGFLRQVAECVQDTIKSVPQDPDESSQLETSEERLDRAWKKDGEIIGNAMAERIGEMAKETSADPCLCQAMTINQPIGFPCPDCGRPL